MGRKSADRRVEFEAATLIAIEGDFESKPVVVEFSDVELMDAIEIVYFGHVDYGDDGYDEYSVSKTC